MVSVHLATIFRAHCEKERNGVSGNIHNWYKLTSVTLVPVRSVCFTELKLINRCHLFVFAPITLYPWPVDTCTTPSETPSEN